MQNNSKILLGIYAPIPTPFTKNGVDYDKLKTNLVKWLRTDLTGFFVLGSSSESVYLTLEEKEKIIKLVCSNVSNKRIIVGTGCESTRETIYCTHRAAELGADAAVLIPPHYFKGNMNDYTLKRYFFDVAEDSPIPIVIYNMPKNTGINLSSDLVVQLSKHENIIGIKDSSGNIVQIAEIIAGASRSFSVMAGSASFLLPSLCIGASGGILALANILPNECIRIFNYFKQGNLLEARKLQLKILPVNKAVTSRWGIAGLKAAMDICGYFGGEPRLPILPLKKEAREELNKLLQPFLNFNYLS